MHANGGRALVPEALSAAAGESRRAGELGGSRASAIVRGDRPDRRRVW